jgi:hypothetical protein
LPSMDEEARGVKLGRYGAEVLAPKYHAEAVNRAKELEPIIRELRGLYPSWG